MRKVDSKVYNKEYYLNVVDGSKNFDNFLNNIDSKFKIGLKIAKLKKSEKILDFGCGRGEIVFYAHLFYGCESTGIDYSADAIKICNEVKRKLNLQNNSFVKFLQIYNDQLPFVDESFDVIFFLDVWEHIYPEQMDKLLKEFYRILKKEGRIVIHTAPNKRFLDVGFPKYTYYFNYFINKIIYRTFYKKDMARFQINPRSDYEKIMHINEQTKESVETNLKKFGFEGKTFIDDYFIMFSSPVFFIYYLIAQPFYLPFLKNIFGEHIWAEASKKLVSDSVKSEKYLTIPQNFSGDDYYRFFKMNLIIGEIIKNKALNKITIVDIGSGNGYLMKYIKENCNQKIEFKFIGVDKYVKEKAFNFQLINQDVEETISLPGNFADIVIAAEIIEHINNTNGFIKEIYRILKKDGEVLLTTPNLSSYFNRLLLFFGYQPYHSEVSNEESGFGLGVIYKILGRSKYGNKTAGHLRLFTLRALKDFIEFHEFKIIQYYPVYFSHSREDNKRKFLIKIFFMFDKIISLSFPFMASGLIIHFKRR